MIREKIRKLAKSPVILSEIDMENFVNLMGLSLSDLQILKKSKEIIKKYYLINGEILLEDENIIDQALALVYRDTNIDYTKSSSSTYSYPKEIKEEIQLNTIINTNNLEDFYQKVEELITTHLFIFSPIYSIIIHFIDNSLNDEDDIDTLMEKISVLSNKHTLEELIFSSEQEIINFFSEFTTSIREEIENIIKHDLNNIFYYDQNTISSLKMEMNKYRNIVIPKMNEMHTYSEQLKNFWVQNEDGVGKFMADFIKGGALGMAGAALFGPLGIAAAIGASYFGASEEDKKKEAIFDTIYENWASAYNAFYFKQLKEYYMAYKNFIFNITQQYITNFKLAHKLSISLGKKNEYENYIKKEIEESGYDDEFVEMRNGLKKLLDNFFNE